MLLCVCNVKVQELYKYMESVNEEGVNTIVYMDR